MEIEQSIRDCARNRLDKIKNPTTPYEEQKHREFFSGGDQRKIDARTEKAMLATTQEAPREFVLSTGIGVSLAMVFLIQYLK